MWPFKSPFRFLTSHSKELRRQQENWERNTYFNSCRNSRGVYFEVGMWVETTQEYASEFKTYRRFCIQSLLTTDVRNNYLACPATCGRCLSVDWLLPLSESECEYELG